MPATTVTTPDAGMPTAETVAWATERTDGGRARREYLFDCLPPEFKLAAVQETYGAGDYRVTAYALDAPGLLWEVLSTLTEKP